MTDLAKLSDAELKAMYAGAKPAADMTDAELRAAYEAQPSTVADVAKSGGIGLAKGGIGLAGLIGDLSDLGAKGLEHATNFVTDKLGMDRYEPPKPRATSVLNYIPTSSSLQKNIEGVTGEFYKPQTRAGKYAETVGEFLPASMLGPGGMAAKLGTGTAAALGSEGAGQLTEGTKAEPYARVAGALMGGVAPSAIGRGITPVPATAARQRLVDILNEEGVTSLTAGQRTGSKPLKYAESILGDGPGAGAGTTRIQEEGQRQFTEAAMRRAGSGPEATPEVLAANNQRLGDQFRDLSARNTLVPDNQMITDITDAVQRYRRIPNSQQAQMLQGYIDDIVPHINAGSMPGIEYQPMRSMLSADSKSVRQTDPYLSRALAGIRNALDNAMERSIPAGSADAQLWRDTRREYGAQKVIEKTASRAGEATAEGQLVPANLRNTVSAENRGAYARGEGNFSELARAGSGVMAPLPNSGTAQRNLLTDIPKMLITAPVGRILTSRPAQSYLGNQVLARQLEHLPANRLSIARALLAENRRKSLEGPAH